MSLTWLVVILLLVAIFGGVGWGYRPSYGYWSFSPVMLIFLVLIALVLARVIVL